MPRTVTGWPAGTVAPSAWLVTKERTVMRLIGTVCTSFWPGVMQPQASAGMR